MEIYDYLFLGYFILGFALLTYYICRGNKLAKKIGLKKWWEIERYGEETVKERQKNETKGD